MINDINGKYWGKIDFDRIVLILNGKSNDPIDFIATDTINGPIDADKLDYIKRDSYYCGVSYGDGIDYNRFLNSLTVKEVDNKIRLAYYFKGRTAISSMLLARYQLYGSVYWHHTYRCLHSMIYYATQLAFGRASHPGFSIPINKSKSINMNQLRKLYYYRVICKMPWVKSWADSGCDFKYLKSELKDDCPMFQNDCSLDFIYRFTDTNGKNLLKKVHDRQIFKRVYSKSLQEVDISLLVQKCEDRVNISMLIQKRLFDTIKQERAVSQRTETSAELMVSDELIEFEMIRA